MWIGSRATEQSRRERFVEDQPTKIVLAERRVRGLFSAWDAHDVDALMGHLMGTELATQTQLELRVWVRSVQPGAPILYSGEEQVRSFVEALTPGFQSRVRNLQGSPGPNPSLALVDTVVTISADLLRNAGIDSAEGSVFAQLLTNVDFLIREIQFRFEQEMYEKLQPILPPGIRQGG